MAGWEEMHERLQKLGPADMKRKSLESEEIPAIETKIKGLEKQIPELRSQADEVHPLLLHSSYCSLNIWIPTGTRETRRSQRADPGPQ